jgi:tetratricopeptide (TPR) repeat protein
MKDLLKFSKYLESDFANPNPTYQSKMDLAVSSLVTGDYQKAKNMFDAAIEIDSQFPSAWLGKAFSEIAYVEDEHFNSLTIDEYLSRAMRSTDNILKYKVAIAGCLAYRHADIIKKCVLAVEEALRQKKEAEKAKSRAIATAIVGSMFTGKDKSLGSNIVGGALIAGGTTYAMQSHLKAKELELLGNSIYTSALSQTYLSTPIIHLCGTLEDKIDDVNLRGNFNVVMDSWKDSVIYLYNKQREQLVTILKNLSVSEATNIQTLLNNPNSIQEVGEFVAFMKIIGLSNHKIFDLLNKLFKETLPKHFDNPEAISALEEAKKKQKKAYRIGGVLIVLGVGSIFTDFVQREDNQWLPWVLDIGGIIIGVWLSLKARTTEMKDFEKVFAQAINDINSISITRNDFNLNLNQSTDDVNFDTLPQLENKSDEHIDIINMAKSGKKLEAVKLLKDRTGWDFKRCKDWVEARC